tara:strand:+ start:60 stop:428 length:369 start_codon:yes stop_codon:yes gene_type:complete
MSELKYCQGPDCHTYYTQDRLKGQKGNKTNQTRRRSRLLFGEFCDTRCEHAWLSKYATKAIDHFGRLKEVKHLTEENAWHKTYDWDSRYQNRIYVYLNYITKERRPITEEQFNTDSYTLNVS